MHKLKDKKNQMICQQMKNKYQTISKHFYDTLRIEETYLT